MGSPFVQVSEVDLSTRVPQYPGVYGGMVLRSVRGKIREAVLVTSETELLRMFTPDERIDVDSQTELFEAIAFLQKSDKLWVARAVHDQDPVTSTEWNDATVYADGSKIIPVGGPTTYARYFEATSHSGTGTSGDTEPTWNYTVGEVTVDNSGANQINWTCRQDDRAFMYGALICVNSSQTTWHVPLAAESGFTSEPTSYSSFATSQPFLLYAADPGDWNNRVYVRIVTDTSIVKETGAFYLYVYYYNQAGSYDLRETWTCSLTEGHIDGYGRNIFIEDILQGSSYIRALVNASAVAPLTPKATPAATAVFAISTAYSQYDIITPLTTNTAYAHIVFECTTAGTTASSEPTWNYTIGGTTTSGSATFTARNIYAALGGGYDGDSVTIGDMETAADLLDSPDNIPMTVLMDGGYNTPAYQLYLNTIAQSRNDCVALLSLPYAQEAAAKASGVQTLVTYKSNNLTALATSSFSSILAGYVKIYDKFNDREIWISPTGFQGAVVSYSAANYELWYPPAGWRRGPITVMDVLDHYSKAERDLLYDAGINVVRWDSRRGIAVFGQKTTLARPSALDRLNVRLLLCYLEPTIAYALEDFLFEINDATTRSMVESLLDSYMINIKARRGVYDYEVKCDDENNTAEDIDNHRMNVWLFVKPILSIEYIQFKVVVTRTGMSFDLAQQTLLVK